MGCPKRVTRTGSSVLRTRSSTPAGSFKLRNWNRLHDALRIARLSDHGQTIVRPWSQAEKVCCGTSHNGIDLDPLWLVVAVRRPAQFLSERLSGDQWHGWPALVSALFKSGISRSRIAPQLPPQLRFAILQFLVGGLCLQSSGPHRRCRPPPALPQNVGSKWRNSRRFSRCSARHRSYVASHPLVPRTRYRGPRASWQTFLCLPTRLRNLLDLLVNRFHLLERFVAIVHAFHCSGFHVELFAQLSVGVGIRGSIFNGSGCV